MNKDSDGRASCFVLILKDEGDLLKRRKEAEGGKVELQLCPYKWKVVCKIEN